MNEETSMPGTAYLDLRELLLVWLAVGGWFNI